MKPDFVVVVDSNEVSFHVKGWPNGFSLLIFGGGNPVFWNAVPASEISESLGLLPTWPPRPGLQTANLPAQTEIDLLRVVFSLPELALLASRIAQERNAVVEEILLEDIEW